MRTQTHSSDREQQLMLSMVEQMVREGRSESEIVAALAEAKRPSK
jgi:hypothetical protein